MAVSDTKLADAENPATTKFGDDSDVDFAGRANWLRAAVLGANDGLVSTASLMLGVSAVKHDVRAMVVSGFAGLLALVEKRASVAVRNCHWSRLRNRDQASATKAHPSRGSLRTATKGASTWPPALLRAEDL
ncbi:hypothetical protein QYE76_011750 [Lolium multiflorum]|uniref:Vacuolar iron transporter n=1 Tax=Lolium multiflorum TaxID=4521 RepID=A0AAD8TZQ5_LOLMU|nr:hypothetical protein QYE76_011750 [Lolium multiflorum]